MSGQSRRQSIIETVANIGTGYLVSLGLNLLLLPAYGCALSTSQNIQICAVFTVASLLRSYAWRRAFNWWHVNSEARPSSVR